MNTKRDKNIKMKLKNVKVLEFYEQDKSEIDSNIDVNDLEINLESGITVNKEKKVIIIIMKVTGKPKGDTKTILVSIKTKHTFLIDNFQDIISIDKDKFDIPNQLLNTFVSTAISGTRGILHSKAVINNYENDIIPLINPQQFIQDKH